jgi:hypothetical protein
MAETVGLGTPDGADSIAPGGSVPVTLPLSFDSMGSTAITNCE